MRHVAHIREEQSEQLLSEHLKATAPAGGELCESI